MTWPADFVDENALPIPDLGLACLHCGYALSGLPRHECPECGWQFEMDDFVPGGIFPVIHVHGAPVRSSPQIVELLQRYGITCTAPLDMVDQTLGFTSAVTTAVHICVHREQYWPAVDLVLRHRRHDPLPDPPPPADVAEWACLACGEPNPPSFELCWFCESPRPDFDAALDL